MQGVGRYNNLLNGENLSDDELESFSESNLYSVNSLGNYKIIERASDVTNGTAENITVNNNKVYCCSKLTNYDYYGKVISTPYIYSVTSEYANLVFFLKGPFYAESTTVTITYDTSKVTVVRYPESLEYSDEGVLLTKNAESLFQNIPSGYRFVIDNGEYYKPIKLRISRKNYVAADTLEYFSTTVRFNNGFEDKDVQVCFCETILFYKDGYGYNGFDENDIKFSRHGSGAYAINIMNANIPENQTPSGQLPGKNYLDVHWNSEVSYMWLYNKSTRTGSDKIFIDYSKGVKIYVRILKANYHSGNENMLKITDLSAVPNKTTVPSRYFTDENGVSDGIQRCYRNLGNASTKFIISTGEVITQTAAEVLTYLQMWPSTDGGVVSDFEPYSSQLPENCLLEKDIAIGTKWKPDNKKPYIAEIGLMKMNNVSINGWEL